MSEKLLARLTAPGPKRMLALDGGGIRGAITLGFLKRIETILRERHNNPDLLLCDYFDLIGGTSTGAIIAALLATGHSADDIAERYRTLGGKIFGDRYSILQVGSKMKAQYDDKPLQEELKNLFKDTKFGGDEIRTGLCINTKRADTYSTWPFHNHPHGKFYNPFREGEMGNKDFLLREIVRASTAAPTYFLPQKIHLGNRFATFIDGGVSMNNNPALLLFLMATLEGFAFHWETGADKMMIVSIGTGTYKKVVDAEEMARNNMLDWAATVPDMLMDDASYMGQLLLQYLSKSPIPLEIDMEIGDLRNDLLGGKAALHYLRYQALLEQPGKNADGALEDMPFLPFDDKTLKEMRKMDNAAMVDNLSLVGEIYARERVQDAHFPAVFDIK